MKNNKKQAFSYFNKIVFALTISFFIINNALSLPMSGIYTIGGVTANFPSFTSAVNSLTINGVNGSVVFKVKTGVYTEQIQINAISGVSALNTITFVSETNNQNDVILRHVHPGSSYDYTIMITNCSYISFKNLTIQAEKTPVTPTEYNRVICISNNSDNIIFENDIIKSWCTSSDFFQDNDCISIVSYSSNNQNCDSIYFTNNTIIGGYTGIYRQGDTNTRGIFISNNTFYDQYGSAIYSYNCSNTYINGNKFYSNSDNTNYIALAIYYNKNNLNIDKNYISLKNSATGIYLVKLSK